MSQCYIDLTPRRIVLTDLRYAFRVLRKDLSFTAIAVMTLALGIGASATVFSVLEAVLLRPFPYPSPERVVIASRLPPADANVGFDVIPWGRLDFLAFAAETRAFDHVGAFLGASFNLTGSHDPVRLDGARVSAGFFGSLGVAPQLGRVFGDDVDRPGAASEVVLSDRLWRERFGADPAVVGRAIDLNGEPYTVVGVMPRGFAFPAAAGMPGIFVLPNRSDLWTPLALSRGPRVRGEPSELAVVGRLAHDATLDRAQAELDLFGARMDRELPQAKGWFRTRAVPIGRQLAGDVRRPVLLLFGAVGVLLLIACANVANLMLARTLARTRELVLRAALGAGRVRLAAQLTTEHLLVAILGGAAGLALAAAGVHVVQTFGPSNVPRLADARIDVPVIAFAVAVSVACGLLFGVVPAWTAARTDLASSLRDGGRVSGSSGSRARVGLLVAEVALALVLVIASGLLVRTFVRLARVDAGFNPTRALTFELTLPPTAYSDADRIVAVYAAVLQRLRDLPGVEGAGVGETVPMGGAGESTGLRIPDRPADDPAPPYANYTIISPGYLRAAGTPLLRGRDFADADTGGALPVAIVSAAMARKYWPGQDPIGKQVGVPIRPFDMTVVGVTADVKHLSLREEPAPEIYVPFTQKPWPSMQTMHVVVRTKSEPRAMTAAVTGAVHAVDPGLPLAAVTTLDAIAGNAVAAPRFSMVLVTGFGAAALLLACVGLYGAVSYSVSKRTSEIGIRIALGAPRSRVFALVLSDSARIAAAGVVIGIGLALVLLRAMAGFLYGVEPTDPATFVGLSLLLLSIVLLACYVPARRATRVDPLTAIRTD